jgi:hypothetical protein
VPEGLLYVAGDYEGTGHGGGHNMP